MVCIQIIIHNTMSRNPSGMTIDRLIIFFLTNRNVRKTESSAFLTIPALFTKDIGLNIFLLSRLYLFSDRDTEICGLSEIRSCVSKSASGLSPCLTADRNRTSSYMNKCFIPHV